jgi:hypothetical protein
MRVINMRVINMRVINMRVINMRVIQYASDQLRFVSAIGNHPVSVS